MLYGGGSYDGALNFLKSREEIMARRTSITNAKEEKGTQILQEVKNENAELKIVSLDKPTWTRKLAL